MKMISATPRGCLSAILSHKRNEETRFDLKDTIHDLLQKRVISKLFYIIFIHFNMFLHVNRNKVNNIIDTRHVTTDTIYCTVKSMV